MLPDTLTNRGRSSLLKLKSIVVIGLHKQTLPKSSYRFVLVVTWDDGARSTIYRQLKEIKYLQDQLAVELSGHPEQEEAMRYLAKLKRKARPGIMSSSLGTAQRLRMIDAINKYFEAVTYYLHDVDQFRVLKYFVSPSSVDVDSPNWSKNGKTFFCSNSSDCDVINRSNVTMQRSHSLDNLISTNSLSEQALRRNSSSIASCMSDDSIYVAEEDHVPRDEDGNDHVISLNAGEKVQVISKTETGWWFVKRICVECGDSCGYVPGSFLSPQRQTSNVSSHSESSMPCDCEQVDRAVRDETENVYESVCYPLDHQSEFQSSKPVVAVKTKPVLVKPRPPLKPNNYVNTKISRSQQNTLPDDQDDKIPVQNFNLHRIKIQNLFATKV